MCACADREHYCYHELYIHAKVNKTCTRHGVWFGVGEACGLARSATWCQNGVSSPLVQCCSPWTMPPQPLSPHAALRYSHCRHSTLTAKIPGRRGCCSSRTSAMQRDFLQWHRKCRCCPCFTARSCRQERFLRRQRCQKPTPRTHRLLERRSQIILGASPLRYHVDRRG